MGVEIVLLRGSWLVSRPSGRWRGPFSWDVSLAQHVQPVLDPMNETQTCVVVLFEVLLLIKRAP